MVLEMKVDTSRRNILAFGTWTIIGTGIVLTGKLIGTALGQRKVSRRQLLAVGPPESIIEGGQKSVPGAILIHDERGFAAISSKCTHLGCTITANSRGYECNCHGSSFARDGRVLYGPASENLPFYRVLLGGDGELRVDFNETVSPSSRYVLQPNQHQNQGDEQ